MKYIQTRKMKLKYYTIKYIHKRDAKHTYLGTICRTYTLVNLLAASPQLNDAHDNQDSHGNTARDNHCYLQT